MKTLLTILFALIVSVCFGQVGVLKNEEYTQDPDDRNLWIDGFGYYVEPVDTNRTHYHLSRNHASWRTINHDCCNCCCCNRVPTTLQAVYYGDPDPRYYNKSVRSIDFATIRAGGCQGMVITFEGAKIDDMVWLDHAPKDANYLVFVSNKNEVTVRACSATDYNPPSHEFTIYIKR